MFQNAHAASKDTSCQDGIKGINEHKAEPEVSQECATKSHESQYNLPTTLTHTRVAHHKLRNQSPEALNASWPWACRSLGTTGLLQPHETAGCLLDFAGMIEHAGRYS